MGHRFDPAADPAADEARDGEHAAGAAPDGARAALEDGHGHASGADEDDGDATMATVGDGHNGADGDGDSNDHDGASDADEEGDDATMPTVEDGCDGSDVAAHGTQVVCEMDDSQLEADPKNLEEMIGSMEDSQGSLGPNSPLYKRAYSTKQVEEMMQPSYEMIFNKKGKPPSPSPAGEIGSSPEILSIASTPAEQAEASGPSVLRRGKHIETFMADRLTAEQKKVFLDLCKQKLQSLNDFTTHGRQSEYFLGRVLKDKSYFRQDTCYHYKCVPG